MHTHFSSCWLVSFSSSQRLVSCELADWSAATSTWCRIAAYVIASPLSFCNRWSQRDTSTFFNTYCLRRSTSCCRANILQYPSSHMSPYSGIFVSVALSQTGLDTVGPRIRSWCIAWCVYSKAISQSNKNRQSSTLCGSDIPELVTINLNISALEA